MSRRAKLVLLGLGVGIVALWFSTVWIVPGFLALVGSSRISDLGAAGDMFGAASSLFAGLGAFAVVVVLAIDLRERRMDLRHRQEEHRPFVTLDPVEGEIQDARWNGDHFHLTVAFKFALANATPSPALNLRMSATATGGGANVPATVSLSNAPLNLATATTVEPRIADVQHTATGDVALGLIRQLEASGGQIDVSVVVTYSSVNSVEWSSRVVFKGKLTAPLEMSVVSRVAAEGSRESIGKSPDVLGTDNIVLLTATPITGTWEQRRED